jgi:microcystin-dependent protein
MYAGIVGEIRMYAGSSEPEGWLFCDGREFLHTGTGNKSELYAAIGLTYTGNVGSGGNNRTSTDYFRIPNFSGRIPVGKGTGGTTATAAEVSGGTAASTEDLGVGSLTPRTLGDYGADETHTLTAGESGAGPHYHAVDPQAHTHTYDLWHNTVSGVTYHGDMVNFVGNNAAVWGTETTNATTSTIKASHELNVEGTTETTAQGGDDDDTFRTDKTDLNAGVPAVSAHTQMQPFVVINYIIKY